MNILFIGDVVGNPGIKMLEVLPKIKRDNSIDLTIVNGENSAEGNGILPSGAKTIFDLGADVITGGNHTIRRREIYEQLESDPYLLRPANYPDSVPGKGYCFIDLGYTSAAVINVMGTVYTESLNCPFKTCDALIKRAEKDGAKMIFVDFHAEATSEKRALGFYLDSRVTAVVGTHTHVQTADAQILPGGTAYITDLGMTGTKNSVLGVKTETALKKMRDKLPVRFINEQEYPYMLNGCIMETESGHAKNIRTINITKEG